MGHPSGAPDFCVYCGAIGGDMQEVDIWRWCWWQHSMGLQRLHAEGGGQS